MCDRLLMLALAFAGAPASAAATAAQPSQQSFPSPEAAAKALVEAAKTFDVPALKAILGPDGVDLVVTEDPVQDKNQSAAFAS
jgi:hypothetical protein